MDDTASIQQTLDQILNIVSVRLATVQQSSLDALRASNAALLPALEAHMREIKATIGTALWGKDVKAESVRCNSNMKGSFQHQQNQDTALTRSRHLLSSFPIKYGALNKSPGSLRPESEYSDVDYLLSLSGFETAMPTHRSKWTFVDNRSEHTVSTNRKPRYEVQFSVKLSQYHRDFRAFFKFRFFLLNERILRFELGLRQFTHAWSSISLSDFRVRVANIRPDDSIIFELCRRWDFEGVKRMLENGRASICDVDSIGAGLLDHAIRDPYYSTSHVAELRRFKLHRYLIQQGCVPTATTNWENEKGWTTYPAIFEALWTGQTDTVRLILQSGFTFDLFDNYCPTEYVCDTNKSDYREQVSLLSSLGFVECGAADGNLLVQAVAIQSIPDIIYAKEVLQVGWEPGYEQILSQVARQSRMGIASIVREYGLTPEIFDMAGGPIDWVYSAQTHMAHWFLFADEYRIAASKGFCENFGITHSARLLIRDCLWGAVWCDFLQSPLREPWHFQTVVTALRHLLLHKEPAQPLWREAWVEDWVEAWEEAWDQAWDQSTNGPVAFEPVIVTAQDIAKAWDRNIAIVGQADLDDDTAHGWEGSVRWDSEGRISPVDAVEEPDGVESSENTQAQASSSLFASINSTDEGRRQMKRYPLVKAFCCALQLAGFQAEMDDDGDIWYDDDDCDRYSDAVEDQEDYVKPGPLRGTCKICRDPEGYGLGHILEEAEEGLVEWRQERQKFVDRGALEPDGWEWPSWTRRGGRV